MVIGIDANEANQSNRVGVGQFAFNVISQLEKIDRKNKYIIYLKSSPLADLPKEREGWKYKVFGPGKMWTQFALPLQLFTQKEKLDVFYTPSHYSPRFSPFPTIISIMDLWHHRHPEQFDKKDLFTLKNWEAYSVKNASRIVTISEFTKSEIVKFYKYPEEKIFVAYPGYNEYRIQNNELRIKGIKEKCKINNDYLLYLGTLQPKKNIEGLIEAFALLITSHQSLATNHYPPITLVIAGKKGWLFEEIFEKVKSLGLENKVIFTGFIKEENKPYLISGAKAFVLPSFYEGFGIPVLEAMSLGVPVVISSEGSLPEVGGKAAIYFDPSNIEDIAEKLKKALSLNKGERDEIIKEGLKQVKVFSWEKCAKVVLSAIEKET